MLLDLWFHANAGNTRYTWYVVPDQGIARNLANNLKWRSVSDVEVRCVAPPARAGFHPVDASGGAFIPLSGTGTYAGIGIWGIELEANGFAQWGGNGCISGVRLTAEGNGFAEFKGTGLAKSGSHKLPSEGSAVVSATFVVKTATGIGRYFATGIQNPSDEEVVVMLTNLLTRKRHYVNVPSYRRNS